MSPEQPSVTAEWVQRNGHRLAHIAATRGSVTTEATLTEAEAHMLLDQLQVLLPSTPESREGQARNLARTLLGACPMKNLPWAWIMQLRDDPAVAWLFEAPAAVAGEG